MYREKTGEKMEKKISVLGVWADRCTAKDAMRICVEYSHTDALNIVEILTADVLVQSRMTEGVKENIAEADLVLIGDKAILEAAGITDRQMLKETEGNVFLKMFLRFLKKDGQRLFLVGDSQEDLAEFQSFLETHHQGLRIVGSAVIPEHDKGDDMIVNQINGLEVDCILSGLSVAKQEAFIKRNRNLLNARLWMRTGKTPRTSRESSGFAGTVRNFLRKHILIKEMEKENRKKEN